MVTQDRWSQTAGRCNMVYSNCDDFHVCQFPLMNLPLSVYWKALASTNNCMRSYDCHNRLFSLHIDDFMISGWFRKTRQIWGIWKLRLAYSPETPNLGQNRWCFVPCDLEIWRMTLENDRASLLCCFKLCATFHSHWWIQTGVTVRKRPIWVQIDDF